MGHIVVRIDVDDKGNPAIARLGKNAEQAKKPVASLGETLKTVFVAAGVLQGLRMLYSEIAMATQEANNFEQALTRISGVAQISGDSLDMVRQGAKDIARETEFSATQITNALLEVVKMGYDVEGALEVLPNTVNLATASMEDLAEVSRGTVNVIKAFGLGAHESERVANVMATAFNATSLDLRNYMDAMTYAAPIARSLGVSLEEASASMGLLTDMSIAGSHAGTTLKNTMLRLLNPTERAAEALANTNTEGMGLADILKVLIDNGMQTHELLDMFNLRAVAGALAIGTEADAVNELEKRLKAQGVTAKQVAEVMRKNYNTQLLIARQNLNEVVIEFNELITPYKIEAVQYLTRNFQSLAEWVRNNQEPIEKTAENFSKFVKVIAPFAKETLTLFIDNWQILLTVMAADKILKTTEAIRGMVSALDAAKYKAIALNAQFALVVAAAMTIDQVFKYIEEKQSREDKSWANFYGSEEHVKQLKRLSELREKWDEVREPYSEWDMRRPLPVEVGLELRELGNEQNKITHELREALGRDYVKDLLGLKGAKGHYRELESEIHVLSNALDFKLKKQEEINEALAEEEKAVKRIGDNETLGDHVGDRLKDQKIVKPLVIEEWDDGDPWGDEALKKAAEEYNLILLKRQEREQRLADHLAEIARKREEAIQQELAEMRDFASELINLADVTNSSIIKLQNQRTENHIDNLNKEMAASEREYRREMGLASTSAFKREMLEQRLLDEKLANEEKLEAAREEQADKEQRRQIFVSALNAAQAVLGVMADQPGGIYARLAAGMAMTAATIPLVTSIAAANMRDGSGDEIRGHGNSTSDSLLTRVSVGERVLSQEEKHRLGGNEAINQMIDRGVEYSSSKSNVYYIDTAIGEREWIEKFIDRMAQQISR